MVPSGGRMITESGGTRPLVIPIGVNGEIEDGESGADSKHHSGSHGHHDIAAVLDSIVIC